MSIQVIAFDIVETVFPLEPLRERFVAAGLGADDLEVWFATALRDAFALTASDTFTGFPDVLAHALHETFHLRGVAENGHVETVLAGMSELEADRDAPAAFARAHDAGLKIMALTNGGADSTRKLLQRSGLQKFVAMEVSVDEVGRFKPSRDVYLHAASRAGVSPGEMALVAAHPWDVHGAKKVGFHTAYVQRKSRVPNFMISPDVTARTLLGAVEGLLGE